MALPANIDPTTPAGSDSPSLGDDQFRALKLAITDLLGIPVATNITVALTASVAGGLDEIIFRNAAANATAAGRLRRNATNLTWHDGTSAYAIITTRGLDGANLLSVDEVVFTNALANATAGGRLRLNNTALSFHDGTAARQVVTVGGIALGTAPSPPIANALYRESLVKGWVKIDGTNGLVLASYNVSSLARNSAGDYTVTWDRVFSSVNYVVVISVEGLGGIGIVKASTQAAGTVGIQTTNASAPSTPTDFSRVHVVAIGTQ